VTGAECQRKVASRGASQRLAGYVSHSAVALLLKKRQQKLKRYERAMLATAVPSC